MIEVQSLAPAYRGLVSNGTHQLSSDAPVAKGGGAGFSAHQLLEASLGVCINMAVRVHADDTGIALKTVVTRVSISWPDDETARFEYALELTGELSPADRAALEAAAASCPVSQTLSKHLVFAPAA